MPSEQELDRKSVGSAARCRILPKHPSSVNATDPAVVLGPDFDGVLTAARRGDEHAFGRLWWDLHPALLRYLQVIGAESADDVASEVWLDVACRLPTFGGDETAFRGWLFTIARRGVIDSWRRTARTLIYAIPDAHLYEQPGPDETAEGAAGRITAERAMALIANLPREQAEVIILRVVAGLGTKEVAELLGTSPGAVRVAAHRGLRRLAALLVEQGVGGGVTQ
jgi:RNA polymerase sigma-70 factor (ECF subfamily)